MRAHSASRLRWTGAAFALSAVFLLSVFVFAAPGLAARAPAKTRTVAGPAVSSRGHDGDRDADDRAKPRRHHRRAWYVSAAARKRGNGSRAAPFSTLSAVERASRPGDKIVILRASKRIAPLDGGIALKTRQALVGAGAAVIGSRSSALPRIENTQARRLHGDAVVLASGATVRNLVIGPTYRGGIYGLDVARATIWGNDVSTANTSCTTGFVVQPFSIPTEVPGVGAPFSAGLPNGWASMMVDARHTHTRLLVHRNYVHDSGCADGIDVRAMRTAHVFATVTDNRVTRLRQGANQQSGLAIGMQSTGTSTLSAQLSGNTETYIGSATAGDQGNADSEGLFANSAGRSHLTERVTRNTFAHGLGHLSANCFEVVSSNGGPTMSASLTHSTCEHVVGDILEAVNLSDNATMDLSLDHVRATDSEFTAGPVTGQAEPGDNGDCLLEATGGAHDTTRVTIRNSMLTHCVGDGLGVVSSVDVGTGPISKVSFNIENSRITGNGTSNLRVASASPILQLDGRIAHSSLAGTSAEGTPIILENHDTSSQGHARLDFGGGSLSSPGGNCIYGGTALDVQNVRYNAVAQGEWWGRPGGPAPGRVVSAGGGIDTAHPLDKAPPGC